MLGQTLAFSPIANRQKRLWLDFVAVSCMYVLALSPISWMIRYRQPDLPWRDQSGNIINNTASYSHLTNLQLVLTVGSYKFNSIRGGGVHLLYPCHSVRWVRSWMDLAAPHRHYFPIDWVSLGSGIMDWGPLRCGFFFSIVYCLIIARRICSCKK